MLRFQQTSPVVDVQRGCSAARAALGPAEARVSIPRECGPRFDPIRVGPAEATPTVAEASAVRAWLLHQTALVTSGRCIT